MAGIGVSSLHVQLWVADVILVDPPLGTDNRLTILLHFWGGAFAAHAGLL
jgi:hypothetical protein